MDNRRSFNSCDSFCRRKFRNRAQISCSAGPILSPSTISFELHAKVVEQIGLDVCSYGQLSEVQMLRDLDLNRGSGQGHINIHSTCRTTSVPNHVTVASCTTKIWPFEFRIDIRQSLNSRDSFSRRKFKNRAWTSCSTGHILLPTTISFEFHATTGQEIDLEECTLANSEAPWRCLWP